MTFLFLSSLFTTDDTSTTHERRQSTEENNYVFGSNNRHRQTTLARRKAPTYIQPPVRTPSPQVSHRPSSPAPAVVRHFQPYPAYYSRSAPAQFRTVWNRNKNIFTYLLVFLFTIFYAYSKALNS